MTPKLTIFLAGAAAVLAAACTTAVDGEPKGAAAFADDPRLGEPVDRLCFARQIHGFGQTTDRTIVVEASVNEHYLIETAGYCPDLDWAQSISFDAFSSCLSRGDSLIPYTSIFGPDHSDLRPPRECLIREIYAWDPEAGED
ncbi:hypothetical protein E5163_02035 [Marinicauda algicola]|uniref:Uncharacterized protein n=1 Tax=Marinicauda algicola TaxID=2029849 RepID=A0A4S2H3K7_9PROT|nr:DUF6491 family protein [Marinicauda algicola]TGY89941.1 hypothetical protein E5163_02035 [Marinicauda algicola]